jgi:amino acid adenylation domain-containing protein
MLAEPHGAALVAEAGVLAEAPQEPQLVHAVFEARAGSDPDAVAIESEGAAITYGDLDARASRLARALVEAGATAERPIGVHIDRSIDMVVALLAILKTGAAFVPLDPSLPVERIHAIVADADLQLIVTQAQHADALAAAAPPLIVERRDVAAEAAPAPRAHVSVDAIACIYYTSGSTGTPKGVMLSHRCVMGRLDWLRRRYPLTIGDRVLHKTPLAFDVALWEVFGPLRAGATILMADAGSEADVPHIARLLAADRTVFAHFVPSMLDAFLSYAPRCAYPDLRWVQLSGEAVPAALLERFREHFDAELHSMYGQTETSEVAAWEGREWRGAGGVPIGRQIGIYRLLVLDDALAPVPPGVPGEICVAGCGGLAHGYHARPELTAERFVPNPYPREPGERLYRTGDWASRGRDGVIHFLGRGDGQVKVRGCRVETGDVEAALQRHAAVRVSAVVARPDASGHMELVAYVVGDEATTAELSAHVGRLLPRYMIPATFVRLVGLPLTTSGKVDRHSLPAPRPCDRDSRAAATSPRNPLESDLVQTWKEVLGLTDVGIADNYFAVGGNSLTCMQILHRVSTTFGVEVSVRSFFEAPTVEGLAGAVEDALVAMVVTLTDDEVDRRLAVLTAGAPRV